MSEKFIDKARSGSQLLQFPPNPRIWGWSGKYDIYRKFTVVSR